MFTAPCKFTCGANAEGAHLRKNHHRITDFPHRPIRAQRAPASEEDEGRRRSYFLREPSQLLTVHAIVKAASLNALHTWNYSFGNNHFLEHVD